MENSVMFRSDDLQIEGLYAAAEGDRGVVVSHPHPQMGGSMINNVVEAITESFFACGYSTMRFNFRGVGRSGGCYDNGIGEQHDILEAGKFLHEQNIKDIVLAGYSFGAWISARVLAGSGRFLPAILVSPPVDFLPFNFAGLEGRIGLIACGDRDAFCNAGKLGKVASETGARLEVITGADHFFIRKERVLAECIKDYLSSP